MPEDQCEFNYNVRWSCFVARLANLALSLLRELTQRSHCRFFLPGSQAVASLLLQKEFWTLLGCFSYPSSSSLAFKLKASERSCEH